VKLSGAVRCADEQATQDLAKRWAALTLPAGDGALRAWAPVLEEMAKTYRSAEKTGWVILEAHAGEESVSKLAAPR
jgi:hypothetical protein